MAFDCCSLDLNVADHLEQGFAKDRGLNVEGMTYFQNDLENALFELYKKEKVKSLKWKFNIQSINDLNHLKRNKISCFEESEGNGTKLPYHEPPDNEFQLMLESAYGQVLSSEKQADICQISNNYCIQVSKEQKCIYQSMIFSILEVMCSSNEIKDDVANTFANGTNLNVHQAAPREAVMHELVTFNKPEGTTHEIDLTLRTVSNPLCCHQEEKCVVVDDNIELRKKSDLKVSFVDLNEPAPNPPQHLVSSLHKGIRGVDYVPDTFSPTPPTGLSQHDTSKCDPRPSKQAMKVSKCNPGPSKKCNKVAINVIDLEGGHHISCVGPHKTPQHMAYRHSSDMIIKSPEVVFVCERKVEDKLKSMCRESDEMYNEKLTSLRHIYQRASKGINEAEEDVAEGSTTNCSIVEECYCSERNTATPATILQRFSLSSKFPVTKKEILFYMAICKLSCHEAHHDLYAVDIGDVHVNYSSRGHSMVYGGKVGSFVINVHCRKFFLEE